MTVPQQTADSWPLPGCHVHGCSEQFRAPSLLPQAGTKQGSPGGHFQLWCLWEPAKVLWCLLPGLPFPLTDILPTVIQSQV